MSSIWGLEYYSDIISPPGTPEGGNVPGTEPLSKASERKIARTYRRHAKTLRLSSDQLKSLNLKPGANSITFSLSNSTVPACGAQIFLWDSTDLVIVSDIDGTITRSDGLDHVFAMIGYEIMYLTSRAIGQAHSPRDYLKGIERDDCQLPESSVIMSPDRLMASLHSEVIMRESEVFKMTYPSSFRCSLQYRDSDYTPASPAMSARSDTSNQRAGAETVFAPATATAPEGSPIRAAAGQRSAHLRQMSSLERFNSRLAALTQPSSSISMESRSSSSSSPFVDSDEDHVELEEGGVWKRRKRSNSMMSMPGSPEDDVMDGADEPEEGYRYDGEAEFGQNEEEATEEAFHEHFLQLGR
ncbi:hypothetical protein AZE42_07850 [Rhizopogon vesiculosus]|uniref:LNS2/PITP domain-containing protein n=1 Tax=Rhizopogon vesiculosus TaxID=180088 RepID=A0A1J8QC71_9AGAM|nr:hypothetical protein AZE42_07850 [Rhizopogon vesiculosus]